MRDCTTGVKGREERGLLMCSTRGYSMFCNVVTRNFFSKRGGAITPDAMSVAS
jgi:hypothetical protein